MDVILQFDQYLFVQQQNDTRILSAAIAYYSLMTDFSIENIYVEFDGMVYQNK